MLIRRKPRTPPRAFTDAQGFKTPDAPRWWPFGMRVVVPSKAQKKVTIGVRKNESVD
jgi:hypothetical protein